MLQLYKSLIFLLLSGVLLLNSVLTVRNREPTSHQGWGWEEFTDAVVQSLSRSLKGLVFLLWGSYAQRKGKFIDRVSLENQIIKTVPMFSNFYNSIYNDS